MYGKYGSTNGLHKWPVIGVTIIVFALSTFVDELDEEEDVVDEDEDEVDDEAEDEEEDDDDIRVKNQSQFVKLNVKNFSVAAKIQFVEEKDFSIIYAFCRCY